MGKIKNIIEHKSILYRPDIDGLRSIAVVVVILFHIWPSTLTGGFIGVDVFFVISGFLITSIINKEIHLGTFTFAGFYTRRMKRILPVFYFMILLSSIAAYLMLLPGPDDYVFYAKTALSAGISLSNMYFSHHNNYFSPNSNEYPLLHTWSLSVEEQYYLLWPVILLFLIRWRKVNVWIKPLGIVILFSASLGFSMYCTKHNVDVGYYSIFSRAFELMLGSILALLLSARFINLTSETKFYHIILSNVISMAGLLMIIGASYWLTDKYPFPGVIALLPTFGTVLIIYAGHLSHKSLINKILSFRPFVFIGLMSYSMYLWHWPLLAFWHYYNPGASVTLLSGTWILFFTLILSLSSYFFIELPIKRQRYTFREALIKFQLIPLCLVLVTSSVVIKTNGVPIRVSNSLEKQTFFLSKKYCYDLINANCIIGDSLQKPTKVILFGDSHAGALTPFWDQIAHNYNFSIKNLSVGSCYPLINVNNDLPSSDPSLFAPTACSQQIKYVTNHLNEYDLFILAASWHNYYKGSPRQPIKFIFDDELKNTLQFLQKNNKHVIIMSDVPVDAASTIIASLRHSIFPLPLFRDEIVQMNNQDIRNKQIKALSLNYPNVYFFDVEKYVTSNIKTFPYYDGLLLYKDGGHLNQFGSEVLAKKYLSSKKSLQLKLLLESWSIILQ